MCSAVCRTPREENGEICVCAATSPFAAAVAPSKTRGGGGGGVGTPILEIGAGPEDVL